MIITTSRVPVPDSPPYLVCVLELPGAVIAWRLADGPESPSCLTILDVDRCDWLWRLVGEDGHLAVVESVRTGHDGSDLTLGVDPAAARQLHRLAYGHWLRRWWPASVRGPVPLDPVLLDLEVAVLTLGADAWFSDDTFDSDPAAPLARWSPRRVCALAGVATPGAPQLLAELARHPDELVPHWSEADLAVLATLPAAGTDPSRRDFALAAGGGSPAGDGGVIARGHSTVDWQGVPPGILDAAEDTVSWLVEAAPEVEVEVRCDVLPGGDPTGIAVRLVLPPHPALATDPSADPGASLDAAGRARIPVPIPAAVAWQLPWQELRCTVGVAGNGRAGPDDDGRAGREAVRHFVRGRLADPGHPDLFVAERAAAELDY